MALGRAAELRAKAGLVSEAFRRTGRIVVSEADCAVGAAGQALGYRTRLRLHVGPGGKIGLFAAGSHTLLEIEACAVARADLNLALERLRELGRTEPTRLSPFAEVELRWAPAGPALTAHLTLRQPGVPAEFDALGEALGAAVSLHGVAVPHEHTQRWPLPGGIELWAPPGVFTQVNWEVNLELVRAVLDGARLRGVRTFVDLYAGAGNFSLSLLRAGLRGVAVEASTVAVDAARRAAAAAGLAGDSFFAAPVETATRHILRDHRSFDLVLLDPPRAGCRTVVDRVCAWGAPWLALCSCDPATLARDLREFLARGYELDGVQPFDMFPRTHHVETLVWLRRGARPS